MVMGATVCRTRSEEAGSEGPAVILTTSGARPRTGVVMRVRAQKHRETLAGETEGFDDHLDRVGVRMDEEGSQRQVTLGVLSELLLLATSHKRCLKGGKGPAKGSQRQQLRSKAVTFWWF